MLPSKAPSPRPSAFFAIGAEFCEAGLECRELKHRRRTLDSGGRNIYFGGVSKKSGRIAELIESCRGKSWDAHYLGYFECFNRGFYFEAHDVLEELWLTDKRGPNYSFHKGLIQLAGAFVHLQKDRLRPSNALFNLAKSNLTKYPAEHDGLNLGEVLRLIADWQTDLARGSGENPIKKRPAPQLAVPGE